MKTSVYFPGLNGIRFFAALSVIFFHIADTENFGISRKGFFLAHLVLNGNDAVSLFFVLSGFLITFLLLQEQRETSTIQVKKFYWRRILRIWPLYYFMVFLGFLVFPLLEQLVGKNMPYSLNTLPNLSSYFFKFGAYLIFIPHVATYLGHSIIGIEQLWSIGVEENFYLMWPALFKWFSNRIVSLLLGVIFFKEICYVIYYVVVSIPNIPPVVSGVLGLINFVRFENMAVGGIGAYILFTNQKHLLKIIFHPIVDKLVLVIIAANILFFTGQFNVLINQALSVVYIIFILNVSSNPRSTLKLEYPILNQLGRISYGIYMYHVLVLAVMGLFLSKTSFAQNDSIILTLSLYVSATLITIAIAYLSYYYFEQPFLRRKRRYTIVASGEPITA